MKQFTRDGCSERYIFFTFAQAVARLSKFDIFVASIRNRVCVSSLSNTDPSDWMACSISAVCPKYCYELSRTRRATTCTQDEILRPIVL